MNNEEHVANLENQLQIIITNASGEVQESDQRIFELKIGQHLGDFHPFFIDMGSLTPLGLTNTFSCIGLDIEDKTYLTDIEIKNVGAILAITIHDLTKHYASYQKLAQTKNELAIENEVLDKKTDVFEQQDKSKNTFLQYLSHELRTPLTHITSFTTLLDSTPLDKQQKDYVALIGSASKTLNTMVDELLDFQRIASGEIQCSLRPFSFGAFITSLRLGYELRAGQKGLYFKLVIDEDIPDVLVTDSHKLFQVLTNLLDNALKYTSSGGVTLKVRLNQKWGKDVNLSFQISDTGISIPKEKRVHIFESFVRLENSIATAGSGLGLTVVKKLLKALKADINVTSIDKGGNTFYFDLSVTCIRKAVDSLPKVLKKRVSKTVGSKNPAKRKNILVIENDPKTQMILFKFLLDEHAFSIDPVETGDHVISLLIQNKYDLIILDINLPTIKGHEIATLVRDLPNKKLNSIPIIAVTANAFESNINYYKSCGITRVITKPFQREVLIQAVYDVL